MSRARDLANSADNDISGTLTVDDITLSGNITVGGTVDGRDLATDGSKLDGVESGATADQTKADIDALNINADTLDGQHGSYYTAYADTAVSNLVDSAPATLDTLNELAAALGDDPNFATTTATNIGTKVSKSGDTMTGNLDITGTLTSDGLTVDGTSQFDNYSSTSGKGRIQFGNSGQQYIEGYDSGNAGSGSYLSFGQGTSEAARFDNSGSLLVGMSSNSITSTGIGLVRDGTSHMYSGGTHTLELGRGTNDGDILKFNRSGTAVGSIGNNTDFFIASQDGTGLRFNSTQVLPCSESGATQNGSRDLGASGSRFGNGYFSGAVYGNTFSAVSYVDTPDIYLGGNLYHNGDTNTYISFPSNDNIAIATGGTNRIYVDNSGVRIGDTGNAYVQPVSGSYGSFQIDGGSHAGWEGYSIGGRAVFMHDNTSGTGIFNDVEDEWLIRFTHNAQTDLYANGNNLARLETDGDFHADGNVIAYSTTISDPRLKENIQPVTNGLEKVMKLNGYTFNYKADGVASAGVMSPEVKEVLPSAIKKSKLSLKLGDDNETAYDIVQYDQLTALFIEAIKDLKAEIDELKAKLEG